MGMFSSFSSFGSGLSDIGTGIGDAFGDGFSSGGFFSDMGDWAGERLEGDDWLTKQGDGIADGFGAGKSSGGGGDKAEPDDPLEYGPVHEGDGTALHPGMYGGEKNYNNFGDVYEALGKGAKAADGQFREQAQNAFRARVEGIGARYGQQRDSMMSGYAAQGVSSTFAQQSMAQAESMYPSEIAGARAESYGKMHEQKAALNVDTSQSFANASISHKQMNLSKVLFDKQLQEQRKQRRTDRDLGYTEAGVSAASSYASSM
jgi:hypothetical protein